MYKLQFIDKYLPLGSCTYFMVAFSCHADEVQFRKNIYPYKKFDFFYSMLNMYTFPDPNILFTQYVDVSPFYRLSSKECAVRASVETSLWMI